MTSDELKRIRELAEKATPGEWWADCLDLNSDSVWVQPIEWSWCGDQGAEWDSETNSVFVLVDPDEQEQVHNDARFIAATDPTTTIQLIDELTELRERLEKAPVITVTNRENWAVDVIDRNLERTVILAADIKPGETRRFKLVEVTDER